MIIFQFLISELVERLILTERIESVIHLTYLALIAMAYFSLNAEIILGIKLTLWQHIVVEITEISGFLQNLGLLFGIDFLSFLINGFILWEICGINVIKVLPKLQKRFWFFMAIAEEALFLEVSFFFLFLFLPLFWSSNFSCKDFHFSVHWMWYGSHIRIQLDLRKLYSTVKDTPNWPSHTLTEF